MDEWTSLPIVLCRGVPGYSICVSISFFIFGVVVFYFLKVYMYRQIFCRFVFKEPGNLMTCFTHTPSRPLKKR